VLLGLVGAGVYVTGIMLRSGAMGVPLVVLGVGCLVYGIVMPFVKAAEIGLKGFTITQAATKHQAAFDSVVTQGQRELLQTVAWWLTANERAAEELTLAAVEGACKEWRGSIEELDELLYCNLANSFLGESDLHLLDTAPVRRRGGNGRAVPHELRALHALKPTTRAVAVLSVRCRFKPAQIGHMLGLPAQTVVDELHEATRVLDSELVGRR
jgi:hypothetical protein